MKLRMYDGRHVRIVDRRGDAFEGVCSYNGPEYNEHEFGRAEDALEIADFLFFRSEIKELTSLEDHAGPFGKYTAPYGKIEELTVEYGADSIREMLFSEEPEQVCRLLCCLGQYRDPLLPFHDEMMKALRELLTSTADEAVREEALRLLKTWDSV